MKKKIVFFLNSISSTSIPLEIANNLNESYEVIIISLYDNNSKAIKKARENRINRKVIGIGLNNRLDIFNYRKICNVIKKIKPDLIHTHHTFSGFLGRYFAKKCDNIPVITTIHTDMHSLSFYQKLMQSINLNIADFIVCNSNNTRDSFSFWQNKLIDVNKKMLIYNGVDIDRILNYSGKKISTNIKEKYYIPDKAFLIGNIARLEKPKDQVTLIKAFKIFRQQIGDSRLIIVGGGSLERELRLLLKKMRIEDSVIITGLLSRKETYKILNTLDLFVVSSIYEGFCNAMVEAMAAGKPIIATGIAPLPEVLGYDNGLFFKKGDYMDLYNKIIDMYEDPLLMKKFGKKAFSYARKEYSLQRCINEYKELYNRV